MVSLRSLESGQRIRFLQVAGPVVHDWSLSQSLSSPRMRRPRVKKNTNSAGGERYEPRVGFLDSQLFSWFKLSTFLNQVASLPLGSAKYLGILKWTLLAPLYLFFSPQNQALDGFCGSLKSAKTCKQIHLISLSLTVWISERRLRIAASSIADDLNGIMHIKYLEQCLAHNGLGKAAPLNLVGGGVLCTLSRSRTED